MDRQQAQQLLVEYGWDAAERARLADLFETLRTDAECQQIATEYDCVRSALADEAADVTPPDGWAAFSTRLQTAATPAAPRVWWRSSALAAAAVLLLAAGWQVGRLGAPAPQSVSTTTPAYADLRFGADEVDRAASVFREVAAVFDQRARWLLLGDDLSDVGVATEPISRAQPLLLLRLALSQDGALLRACDLALVRGQVAELSLPLAGGRQIHYRVAASGDVPPRLHLTAELRGNGGVQRQIGALATDLPLNRDAVVQAGEFVTTSGRYSVKIGFAQAGATEGQP